MIILKLRRKKYERKKNIRQMSLFLFKNWKMFYQIL